jgi:hypothetical protein
MLSNGLIRTIVRLLSYCSFALFLVNELQSNPALPKPYIHSDVIPTMTGFTRFLHEHEADGWLYDKTEHLPAEAY